MTEVKELKNILKPKISIVTLGCKVNQYDTDAMLQVLLEGGFEISEGLEFADIFIINTCAVTAEAERKSRQTVGRILKINENAKIYVCGCASQNNFSQFAKEHVLYISGTDGKIALAKEIVNQSQTLFYCEEADCQIKKKSVKPQIEDFLNSDNSIKQQNEDLKNSDNLITLEKTKVFDKITTPDFSVTPQNEDSIKSNNSITLEKTQVFDKIIARDFSISNNFEDNLGVLSLRTRHYIKVQDGCNNFCSYCIIPYLRGRSRSRSIISILRELDSVVSSSKEVVITGINLSAYGREIDSSLTGLLVALQSYDLRFRLGSLEVGVVTREFLDATLALKHFCPHFHLSLQSGDDAVLLEMNRKYSTKQYFEAVQLIREYYPNAGITTDIIVGFPTETEKAFENSMIFANQVAFSDIHVFSYSARHGTVSSRMPILAADVVDYRQKQMSSLKCELSIKFLLSQLGQVQDVLFETKEDGMWCGHTANYTKVYSTYGVRNTIENVIPTMLYNDGIRV